MRKNKELLLVHSSMKHVDVKESINLMLTPQFYTFKREALPVKYAYQAKKIAPSLFEGLLENGGEYEYAVFQEEDTWGFVAYDIDKITDFLEDKGIERDKIAKLFFAQESFKHFIKPLGLGEYEALVTLDDTVVVVPRMALDIDEPISSHFDRGFTPEKGGVSVKGGNVNTIFSQQQALSLAAIFMLFAGIFMVEGLRYSDSEASKGSGEELNTLYEEYPTLKSTYTRQGIIDKYRSLDTKERKKRDAMKAFSSMIFKGVTLTSAKVDEKKVTAKFSCSTVEVAKRVKELAKKAHYNTSQNKQNNDLIIEGTL